MLFLPIVTREMRVRAKQANTYWRRILFLTVTLLACLPSIFQVSLFFRTNSGIASFSTMAWIAFYLALLAITITSNSLSSERRDGTLGFLFLTDLSSLDVVLGKMAAVGLESLSILLGFIPLLSITFLLGGVTGSVLIKTALTLLATISLSLSLGMWISSKETREFKILMQSLLGLFGLCIVPLVLTRMFNAMIPFYIISPMAAINLSLNTAGQWEKFFCIIAVIFIESFLFLFLTNRTLQRNWRAIDLDKKDALTSNVTNENHHIIGNTHIADPIGYLLHKMPGKSAIPWIIILLGVFDLVTNVLIHHLLSYYSIFRINFYSINYFTHLIYCGIIAWLGCRFFLLMKRDNHMELLMSSPLSREIVKNQWQYFQKTYQKPIIIILAIHVLHYVFIFPLDRIIFVIPSLISMVINISALFWVGMVLGIKLHKATSVIIQTVLLVQLLPGILNYFFVIPLQFGNIVIRSSSLFLWIVTNIHLFLNLAISILWIYLARRYLRKHLQQTIDGSFWSWLPFRFSKAAARD